MADVSYHNFLGTNGFSLVAGGTVAQYRAVKMSTATVVHSAAEGDTTIGASLDGGSSGDLIRIQCVGIAQLTASTSITAGVEVEATSDGKILAAAGAASNSIGVALEAAGADGDIIPVLLKTPNVKGPANS